MAMVIQRFRPQFSGQGVQVEDLCRQLVRRGARASVVTARLGATAAASERTADGVEIRRLRCDVPGLPFTRASTRAWTPVFGLRTLLHLCRRRRHVDVVHVHGLTDGLYGAWLFGRLSGTPVIFEMTLLGTDDPASVAADRHLAHGPRMAMFERCDAYVAMSPALARAYREAGMDPGKLRVIPQGVDTEAFRPADDVGALRRELGLPTDAPIVAFVGSLLERKGIDVLLRAWGDIHRAVPRARLLLVGRDRFDRGSADGAAASRFLEAQLAALPPAAAAAIHRTGLAPARRWLPAADAFLFPSRREGFGTAMIEAMACGLPCVVADLPGITDFVFGDREERHGGIVVPQEDAATVAEAAVRLLEDDAARRRLGTAARRRAVERFDFARIAVDYLQLYDEVRRGRG